jgi:cell cycle checkpoint protein
MSGNSESEDVEMSFLAKISNARTITNILSGIQLKKDQMAIVNLAPGSIKFTVEESKVLQGSCKLEDKLFDEFKCKQPESETDRAQNDMQFKINLSTLIDCLNIFGGGSTSFTSLQMIYRSYGNPLFLMLEDTGVRTDCGLRTLEAEPPTDFNFRGCTVVSKIMMKSECLKEAMSELDWSSDLITFLISPDPPYFRLTTSGPSGSCQVDYPKDSKIFEAFSCSQTQAYSYKTKLLQPTVKALALSVKVAVRMNERGLLNLQHMYLSEDEKSCFTDFFILPQDEETEEDMDA